MTIVTSDLKDTLRRNLDQWLSENVMDAPPRIEACAMTADETGMAMWEGCGVTRRDVKKFCDDHPVYHYVERKVYIRYTDDPLYAMGVLEKCCCQVGVCIERSRNYGWIVQCDGVRKFSEYADELPLAICKFAKALFSNECQRCGDTLNAIGNCESCAADKREEYELPNDVRTR